MILIRPFMLPEASFGMPVQLRRAFAADNFGLFLLADRVDLLLLNFEVLCAFEATFQAGWALD
jgi:hypothetical protein